jgi:hypothetical protein
MRKFSRLVFDAPRRDDDYRKADMCSVPRSGIALAEVPVAGRSGYDGSCLTANPDPISAPPSSTRMLGSW